MTIIAESAQPVNPARLDLSALAQNALIRQARQDFNRMRDLNPAQAGRLSKAEGIITRYFSGQPVIKPLENGKCLVQSTSDPNTWYYADSHACSCKDHEHRPHFTCGHSWAVGYLLWLTKQVERTQRQAA